MRRDLKLRAKFLTTSWILVSLLALSAPSPVHAEPAQQVVDRIVVRIEDDIITLSEMQELAGYQTLVDGQAEPQDRILSELIEQWVVNAEAAAAQFPAPPDSEVDRETASIEKHFTSLGAKSAQAQTYQQRLVELGLTQDTVRRIVKEELYLARYLDYKFRPAVQIDDAAIETYYEKELAPQLAAKNQALPALDNVRETIRELLVQQGINDRASAWFDDTKSHLNIEIEHDALNAASAGPPLQ